MNLLIVFQNHEKYDICLRTENKTWLVKNGEVCINTNEHKFRIELVVRKHHKYLLKNVNYSFAFHEKNTVDFLQYKKCFLNCKIAYSLNLHRDGFIKIDISSLEIENPFHSYDTYISLGVIQKSNLNIMNTEYIPILKEDASTVKKIDGTLLAIRIVFSIFLCAILCWETYIDRYLIRTIFQGNMIWIIQLTYILFTTLYLSSFTSRTIKYFKDINKLSM